MQKLNQKIWAVYFKLQQIKEETEKTLSSRNGEAYIDTVVKILIAVVIGSILFYAIYKLMGETVITNMVDKIKEMFGKAASE